MVSLLNTCGRPCSSKVYASAATCSKLRLDLSGMLRALYAAVHESSHRRRDDETGLPDEYRPQNLHRSRRARLDRDHAGGWRCKQPDAIRPRPTQSLPEGSCPHPRATRWRAAAPARGWPARGKDEVGAVLLPHGPETPWDSAPVIGTSS